MPIDTQCQKVTIADVIHATGLRQRKKERRRKAIIEAAWGLFREKGYDATTIDEIADRAEISRRTFFRYFPCKEDVVFHQRAERLALLKALLERAGKGFEAVANACLGIAQNYSDNQDEIIELFTLVESSAALTLWKSEIEQEWAKAMAETLIKSDPTMDQRRCRILAGSVIGAVHATLDEWLADKGKTDLVQMALESLDIFSDFDPSFKTEKGVTKGPPATSADLNHPRGYLK